jgi:tetratricopeptide (TPR) repeat protein
MEQRKPSPDGMLNHFVGRRTELAALRAALEAAVGGRGSLVLLAGEPGIGKTWLAERLALEAAPHGAVMAWGRAWEGGGAPPYWPWTQVIRQLVRAGPRADLEAFLTSSDPGVAAVARMVPELAAQAPPEPEELAALRPDQARFRLFDAVTTLLARTARSHPLLLVLDDLHWADVPSLLLLKFVAGELHGLRLLIVGAYRDVETRPADPVDGLAGTLGGTCQRIVLRGLDHDEVAGLITLTTGKQPDPQVAARMLEWTGGNPLFVREVARLLAAGVPRADVPEGVRPVLGRRLDLLPEACRELLAVVSVFGREFRLDLAQALTGQPAEEIIELLGKAVAGRLVEEVSAGPGQWRLAHALVREVLYGRLPPSRRMQLHRQAGAAIEARFADDLERRLVELADHYLRAGPAAAASAIDYAARAGAQALELLAWEEAAGHFQRALDAVDLAPAEVGVDLRRHCDLELALAEARMAIGEVPSARAGYERAAALARRLGSAERLARAALGLGVEDIVVAVDELQISLLDEALGMLGGDSALRARVLARLARALLYTPALRRRLELCDEAVAIARQAGDAATLAAVLHDRHITTWGLDRQARQLLPTADEIVQLADAAGDRILALQGRSLRILDLLELGQVAEMRTETAAYDRIARELRQPHVLWQALVLRANLAIIDGRFEEADGLIDDALTQGLRAGDPVARASYLAFRGIFHIVRGDLARSPMEGRFREGVQRWPAVFAWRVFLVVTLADAGRVAEAREHYEQLAANRFAGLPRDTTYFGCLALAVLATYGLGDTARAAVLYDLLLPHLGQVVRASRVGGGCLWPVSHLAGLMAATLGRWDDAVFHFEEAMRLERRMGARPYLATTTYHAALALRERGGPSSARRAARAMDEALASLRELGIRPLFSPVALTSTAIPAPTGPRPAAAASPARAVLTAPPRAPAPTLASARAAAVPPASAPVASPAAASPTAAPAPPAEGAESAAVPAVEAVLRREGEYWTVAWQGVAFRLRDTVGLSYLDRLIAAPGQELPALELAVTPAGSGRQRPAVAEDGGTGPILDQQAKVAYRRRLQELADELAEAEAWNDSGRAARARAEWEALTAQLAAAVGLGGRDRASGTSAERARVSVTKALRGTIRRIAAHHQVLGAHLDRSIRTGTFCAYVPDPTVPVTWKRS